MMPKYMLFGIYLLVFILCFVKEIENSTKRRAGPYINTLLSVRRCLKQNKAYEKSPSAAIHLEAFNDTNGVTLLRGNLTVLKDTSQWKGTSKQFIWADGKYKSNTVMQSSNCQGFLFTIVMTVTGLKDDYELCQFRLGTYSIQDVDVNKVSHLWTSTLVYGKEMWRNEITSPAGLVDCWEFFDLVLPL